MSPESLNLENPKETKMDSKLFVLAKLTFSEYLRCLNFRYGYYGLQEQNNFRRAISFVIPHPPKAANSNIRIFLRMSTL